MVKSIAENIIDCSSTAYTTNQIFSIGKPIVAEQMLTNFTFQNDFSCAPPYNFLPLLPYIKYFKGICDQHTNWW